MSSGFIKCSAGGHIDKNSRERMEDAIFFAEDHLTKLMLVADGHGGAEAVQFSIRNLPTLIQSRINTGCLSETSFTSAFEELDESFRAHMFDSPGESPMTSSCSHSSEEPSQFSDAEYPLLTSGTCVCVAVVHAVPAQFPRLHVANIGDCRLLLSRQGAAFQLTDDHNVRNRREKDRVSHLVDSIGYVRGLQITRSIGNFRLDSGTKVEGQICTPDILELELRESDEFLVMSSDGVFDVLSNSQVVDTVAASLKKFACPKTAAKVLVDRAIARGATDNLSVLILPLTQYIAVGWLGLAMCGKYLVDERDLSQMKTTMEDLNTANVEREAIIRELEHRLDSAVRVNEALAYKVAQYQSLDFDACIKMSNEEIGNRIFELQKKRSFLSRPPSWMVYSTSAAIVPMMLLVRYFLIRLLKFKKYTF